MSIFVPPVGLAAGFHSQTTKGAQAAPVKLPKEHHIKIVVTLDDDAVINGGPPTRFGVETPVFTDVRSPIEYDLMIARLLKEQEQIFEKIKERIYGEK